MADDERRAEIEAVAREANPAFDAATHDLTRAVWLREAERYIAAIDRIRDARGDDDCHDRSLLHGSEEGRRRNEVLRRRIGTRDARGDDEACPHNDDDCAMGTCNFCGPEGVYGKRSRARSPQGEDHETGTVYVAGRTSDVERVRRVQQMFRDVDYGVTFDWTGPDGEIRPDWGGIASERGAALSRRELEAVRDAAITVLLWKDPTDSRQGMVGTLIEAGAALANGRQLWVVGPSRDSVFFHHANARVFDDEPALSRAVMALAEISHSSPPRPEQPPPDALGGQPPAEPETP